MPSSLLFLILVAGTGSLSTLATFEDNPFTTVDCPSPTPSPAPSPSSSSSSNNNSVFQSNVVALLNVLPSAAALTGFASLSRGEGPDRAFVRGICRGDTAEDECIAYLQSAVLVINSSCNSRRRAAIWYYNYKCFLSYADTNASTGYEDAFRRKLYNTMVVSDPDAFERTYYALMSRLAAYVVNGSGVSSSSPRTPMFATGEAVYDPTAPDGTMYGLLQCMRDRTASECAQCLQDSVQQLPRCCRGHQGGMVLAYNCNLRVEIYTYYDLAVVHAAPPPAPTPSSIAGERHGKKSDATLAAALPVGIVLVVVIILGVLLYRRKAKWEKTLPDNDSKEEDMGYIEPDELNLSVLRAATNNFSEANKLGEGGFGQVFKGTLHDGEEIAVKRLSQHSSQGFPELKNELVLASKLKHRNLVCLLGVCLQEEKLIVYEYMPNKSLDTFLFDPVRQIKLDWKKRFTIICGIARGLLYLHEESRLKVIHRDLKPSNVLLDADMNPKISDFGLARAFAGDQSIDITRRPIGTLGYMSPEYAYSGHVSTKSDLFSFGVIILEMVTGRRNNTAYENADSVYLLSYVWGKWITGSIADVVDPLLGGRYPEKEVLKCVEIGLLCVQENPADRPDTSIVALMLSSYDSETNDRRPLSRPAFVFGSGHSRASGSLPAGACSTEGALISDKQPSTTQISENDVTISELQPR